MKPLAFADEARGAGPETDELCRYIRTRTHYWADRLGLSSDIIVRCKFNEGNPEAASNTSAETIVAWEYKQATILWWTRNLIGLPEIDLDDLIVHELCHVLLAPMESLIPDKHLKVREYTVTTCARAFLALAYVK